MMTPRLLLVAALWLGGMGGLAAGKPRIATVDAAELFTNYHRTRTEKAKLAEAQRALDLDPRTEVIAQALKELRDLEAEVRDEDNSEEARQEHFRQFQMKSYELRSLQRDAAQHREEQQKEINRQLVKISKILLVEIKSTIQRIAANEGYDLVLEVGGDTSSQLPTLLYIREATDITAQALKVLNSTRPAPLPAGVTPAPPMPTPPPAPVPLPPAPEPPPLAPEGVSPLPVPRAVPAGDGA